MNLLVFTQKVDRTDTVLGFFHRWIAELSKHFGKVTVICLYKGDYDLPSNVTVLSLGKESGVSKFTYIRNFYSFITARKNEYDAVFVHMNQEYLLLGGFLWKLWGKRTYMWRNHYAGSFLTDIAAAFCTKVFCTSKYSYTAKYSKTVFMPVGVDTNVFFSQPSISRIPHSVLSLGRIAPSKKLDQLIDALSLVKKGGANFAASFVGDASPNDQEYLGSLKKKVSDLNLNDSIAFKPGVPNDSTPAVYSAADIFVNLSPSGMYDKTIFEAMACETLIVSGNKNLKGQISDKFIYEEDNVEDLARAIEALMRLNPSARDEAGKELRSFAEHNHSLSYLGTRLAAEMAP